MIIHFTETELAHLTLQPVDRWQRSPQYLAEREQVWEAEMQKARERGDHMWNGEIYTLEAIVPIQHDCLTLQVSSAEFADHIFRKVKSAAYVIENFGPQYIFPFMTIDCVPITLDGKFVFGIRGDWAGGGTHPVGVIGGGLSKDEMEVHDFAGIRRFMNKELIEETAIECDDEALKFYALAYQKGIFNFMFTMRLPLHSDQIAQLHRDGEFSCLLAWTEQEAYETTLPTSHVFLRWREHLNCLPSLFHC